MYNIYAYIHICIYIIFVGFDIKWNKQDISVTVLNQFKSIEIAKSKLKARNTTRQKSAVSNDK